MLLLLLRGLRLYTLASHWRNRSMHPSSFVWKKRTRRRWKTKGKKKKKISSCLPTAVCRTVVWAYHIHTLSKAACIIAAQASILVYFPACTFDDLKILTLYAIYAIMASNSFYTWKDKILRHACQKKKKNGLFDWIR